MTDVGATRAAANAASATVAASAATASAVTHISSTTEISAPPLLRGQSLQQNERHMLDRQCLVDTCTSVRLSSDDCLSGARLLGEVSGETCLWNTLIQETFVMTAHLR